MYNILYPRLTKADPCLKSVNILCLVIKAEDLRHKPYLIHFLSRTSWIQPQNKTPRHLHSMQGSRIFTMEGRGSAQRIILFHWGGGGGGVRIHGLFLSTVTNTMRAILIMFEIEIFGNFMGAGGKPPPPPPTFPHNSIMNLEVILNCTGINSDFKLILHVPNYNFLVLRILIFYVLLVFLSSKRVWVHSTLYMHITNFRVFHTFSWPVHIM